MAGRTERKATTDDVGSVALRLRVTGLGAVFVLGACVQIVGIEEPILGEGGEGGAPTWASGAGGGMSSSTASSSSNSSAASSSSSSSSSASSSSSSSASSSSSSAGGSCSESPCKLVAPQCGCAAGEVCTLDASLTGMRECVAAGSVPIGGQCTGNDCAAGSWCTNTTAAISTCMRYCAADSDCVGPGGLCVVTLNNGSSGSVPGVTLCTENCDPSTNVGCPAAGTSCQIAKESTGQMRLMTRCEASGMGAQGATCTNNDDCAPTYGCFNAGTKQCLKYCKVGAGACPGGVCNSIGTIGSTEYGGCL